MLRKIKLINPQTALLSILILLLIVLIILVQRNFWFGDYSRSNLNQLKEEVANLEQEINTIQKENDSLKQERSRLGSGRAAIEGIARTELGLIHPDEEFYIFKESKEHNLKEN
tara:strand:- start:8413 stop:8751 length:339 start_codon:yes stop_codon:yes gene_type:complete